MEILKIQLIEIKSGKYNGHSNEKFIDNIREFMENVMREGFKKAMEFDKLKTYFEDEKSN
jgi:Txe/YoeB family toxin of Txe-Axe toxin-antitoxin module